MTKTDADPDVLFEQAGRALGCVLAGNRIDRQKAAERILTDFRSGVLGRLSLERPDDPLDLELPEDTPADVDRAADDADAHD
jgi:ribosome biogenesis GTPase A